MTLPVFYYARGTSWLWNWFGFKAGSAGGAGTVEISDGVYVPDLYVFDFPIFGTPPFQSVNVKGLDGKTVVFDTGTAGYDPFAQLLSPELWQYKNVPYPASALFMGPSVELGVRWVIDEIKKSPIGTPFALGGYSQGAAVMSRVYNECRQGELRDRRADLRAVVTFGNPMREQGHSFPSSSGYSGSCDIPGDTTTGHGTFPRWEQNDFFGLLTNPYIQRFSRLHNTEDLFWDFTMPNEVISGVGDSGDGMFLQQFTANGLRPIPLFALFDIAKAMGELWNRFGVAPAGVPQNELRHIQVVDAISGATGYLAGGGHAMYPFYPPPNADGSIPTSGDTCYQLAAKYLNDVGARIYDELHPTVVLPPGRAAFSWFTSLPSG